MGVKKAEVGETVLQAEGMAYAKALGQGKAGHIREIERSVWLMLSM